MHTNPRLIKSQRTFARAIAQTKGSGTAHSIRGLILSIQDAIALSDNSIEVNNYLAAEQVLSKYLADQVNELTQVSYATSESDGKTHIEMQDDFFGLDKNHSAYDLLCSKRGEHENLIPINKKNSVNCPHCLIAMTEIIEDQEYIDKHVALRAQA